MSTGSPVVCTTHQWSPAGRGGLNASSPFEELAGVGTLLVSPVAPHHEDRLRMLRDLAEIAA